MPDSIRALTKLPWIWSMLAATVLFVLIALLSNAGALSSIMVTSLQFASFFMLVAFGQMLVIATGPGNIDLSIPATITLSGYVSLMAMGQSDLWVIPGLAAAIGVGITVGVSNFAAIRILRVPPIIATMALSNIYMSIAFVVGGESRIAPPGILSAFSQAKIGFLPLVSILLLLLTISVGLLLRRTTLGRSILAVGQNERAAFLTGVNAVRTRFFVYVFCAILAAVTGVLLASFSGGASLNMGEEYLLISVAIVVLGGNSITGGKANAIGIWGASLFMYFLATLSNTLGWGQGLRLIASGLVIILVTILATQRELE